MGVRILSDNSKDYDSACLYDSVTGWAFGPLFEDYDKAQAFLDWLDCDARVLTDKALKAKHIEFLRHLEELEKEKEP